MTVQMQEESLGFQAEAVQILDLMINSLYSNKEIFLRELISNSSDAIDRLRLEHMTQPELGDIPDPLQIRVRFDSQSRTITVEDDGIGMTRQEVIENIGTIAKSGTREFLSSLTGDQQQDATLVGQFGVGFYASFIVAERVVLTTRRFGLPEDEGVRWESDGKDRYTIGAAECPSHGTTIVLHLRQGEDELLTAYRLRTIIKKYSDHISLPILMPRETVDAEGEALPLAVEVVNRGSALWARPKSEISAKEYNNFYQHITGDFVDPLAYLHSKIEGRYEYTLLLFIPSHAPYDMWSAEPHNGVRLHVRRVFIMEDSAKLLPRYLQFVRGVIDSNDLPLNVSRELLQGSHAVEVIRSSAVKKVLKLLTAMAEDEPSKYATFWAEFGNVLKEGVVDDFANRQEVAKLLRFNSTKSGAQQEYDVSLSDYVARMKEGQEKIYYLLTPTMAAATTSPHLEAFMDKGIEVLLLGEVMDNWVVTNLHHFEGKELQSVAQGIPDFGGIEDEADKGAKEQAAIEFADLLARLKQVLGDKTWDVRLSSRLTSSPACLVANEPETDVNLARRMSSAGLPSQPVLEINPGHQLVQMLKGDPDNPQFADWANVLYNEAVLTLGARIEDPAVFVRQLNALLVALDSRARSRNRRPSRAKATREAATQTGNQDYGN
jgi:molecular chaperone HtpG